MSKRFHAFTFFALALSEWGMAKFKTNYYALIALTMLLILPIKL